MLVIFINHVMFFKIGLGFVFCFMYSCVKFIDNFIKELYKIAEINVS